MKKIIYLLSSLLFSIILLTNGQTAQQIRSFDRLDIDIQDSNTKVSEKVKQHEDAANQFRKEYSNKKKAFKEKHNIPDTKQLQSPISLVEKYSLDSLKHSFYQHDDWEPESKEHFGYNEKGQVTSSTQYAYDSEEELWMTTSVTTLNYNNAGQIILMQNEDWNDETERLELGFKLVQDYDERGNTILEEGYQGGYDEDSNEYREIGSWKSSYEFDSNDNQTLNLVYIWSSTQEDWVPYYKEEAQYDDNQFQLMSATYIWLEDDNKWMGISKYEYEPVPLFSETIGHKEYGWSHETDSWFVHTQVSYEVTESNGYIEVTRIYSTFNFDIGQLVDFQKIVYSDLIEDTNNTSQFSFSTVESYQWDINNQQWVNESKSQTKLNEKNGTIEEYHISFWKLLNGSMQWVLSQETTSEKDENGRISQSTTMNYQINYANNTNALHSALKHVYTYENDMSSPSERIEYTYDFPSNSWHFFRKILSEYDEKNRPIKDQVYLYDNLELEWMLMYYTDLAYNANGTRSLYKQGNYDKDTDTYITSYLTENYLDEYGEVLLKSEGQYNLTADDFFWNFRYEKEFDENRNLTMESSLSSEIVEIDDDTDSSEIEYKVISMGYKHEYSFNNDGFRTAYIESTYNNDIKDFEQIEKLNMYYHEGIPGALDYEIYQEKDSGSEEWVLLEKQVLSSNFEILRKDLVLPFQDEDDAETEVYFNYMPEELVAYEWDETSADWVKAYKTQVYFNLSEFTGTKYIQKDALQIYPNPASDYVVINTSGKGIISLYDIQGRKMHETAIENQTTINISNFAEGVYFYHIEASDQIITGKLMKR